MMRVGMKSPECLTRIRPGAIKNFLIIDNSIIIIGMLPPTFFHLLRLFKYENVQPLEGHDAGSFIIYTFHNLKNVKLCPSRNVIYSV